MYSVKSSHDSLEPCGMPLVHLPSALLNLIFELVMMNLYKFFSSAFQKLRVSIILKRGYHATLP